MNKPQIRPPYYRGKANPTNYELEESATDKSQGNDTDVNRIIERFARTGKMPENTTEGQYADVTNLQGDLAQMIDESRKAIDELKTQQQKAKQSQKEQINAKLKKLQEIEEKMAKETEQPQDVPNTGE